MKTILITGVSRGIGRAAAEAFIAEGHFVVGTTQTGEADLAHSNLFVVQLDLTQSESMNACVEKIAEKVKAIDILINNAGVLLDEEETQVVEEKLRKTLEVNLIGTIAFTERIIRLMPSGGHIVNISSSAGSLSLPVTHDHIPHHYPSYKISKAALNMYTRTLAGRLEGNITVSAVHPGWVRTEMGGDEAPISAEKAGQNIFRFALSSVETGQFWEDGKKIPW